MSNECLMLEDDLPKINDCANHLKLVCQECYWHYTFYTTNQTRGTFEVNRRLVHEMCSIGSGYAGAKKFCAVMNFPTLPTKNNYSKLSKSLCSALYDVANEIMKQAGEEIRIMTRLPMSVEFKWLCCCPFYRHWQSFGC